ncbi:MAG: hypothetical protein KAS78_02035, partial [Candidatus Pacebacteria bacterium]|nr:hypothetical protein [Candidatus Paceibacterota bacterium]
RDYRKLWTAEMNGILQASIVNRFWFSIFNNYSYKYFIKYIGTIDDSKKFLGKIYRSNILSKALYPIAKIYFSKNIKDRSSKK